MALKAVEGTGSARTRHPQIDIIAHTHSDEEVGLWRRDMPDHIKSPPPAG